MTFEKIINVIHDANSIGISAHTNPDGDAIGAMVAVGLLCKQLNKRYRIFLEQPSALMTMFEDYVDIVYLSDKVTLQCDCFIALDCGNIERLVGCEPYFVQAKQTICIDHHMTNTKYATHNYVFETASSTCELIYDLVQQFQVPMTTELAKALYMGIVTDTGGFMHSCTSARTHEIAAELIKHPFDFSQLYYKVLKETTYETIKLQSIVSTRLKQVSEKGIYLTYLTQVDIQETQASKDDLSSVVSFLKSIKGVQCIAFLYPIQGTNNYKLSMRANPPYDVAAFCEQFGGGGHRLASGATLEGTLDENLLVIEKLLKHL